MRRMRVWWGGGGRVPFTDHKDRDKEGEEETQGGIRGVIQR